MSTKVDDAQTGRKKGEASIEEQPIAKTSINKYDPFQLKSSLDEEIVHLLEQKQFIEDNKYTDIKIFIALISVVLGVVSHFYPLPFPQSKFLLIGCILGYFACATIYYIIENRFEQDAFFISKDNKIPSLKSFKQIRFCSTIEYGDHHYQFKVVSTNEKGQEKKFESQYPVTMFFDNYGYLHRYKVKEMFEEAFTKFIKA